MSQAAIAELDQPVIETQRPPRRPRRARPILTALAASLLVVAVGCGGDDDSEARSTDTSAASESGGTTPASRTSAPSTDESFCTHTKEGVAPAPERLDPGLVSFVFTDGDDTKGVKTTIQVTRGPGESDTDAEVTGRYCDWEQKAAECKVSEGRAIPYSKAEEFELEDIISQQDWEKYDGVRIKVADPAPDPQFTTALFIRDRDAVIGLLSECPPQ